MDIFSTYGYIGLFLAAFLAATIIPLSSEAVLYYMIYQSGDRLLSVIVASAGNVLGAMLNYWLGYKSSKLLLKKILRMEPASILENSQVTLIIVNV